MFVGGGASGGLENCASVLSAPGCGNTSLGRLRMGPGLLQATVKSCGSRCHSLQSSGVRVARRPNRPLPWRKAPGMVDWALGPALLVPQG